MIKKTIFQCAINKYGIINISPKLIKVLRKLDKYIKSKLEDYSGILTQYNEEYCIMFNENDIVKQVLREKPKTLCLNLKYITKNVKLIRHQRLNRLKKNA